MYVHVYLHSPCVKNVPFLASETEMLYIIQTRLDESEWFHVSTRRQYTSTHLPGTLLPAAPWSAFLPVTRLVGAPRVTMLDSQVVASSWKWQSLTRTADSCWFYSEIAVDHNEYCQLNLVLIRMRLDYTQNETCKLWVWEIEESIEYFWGFI